MGSEAIGDTVSRRPSKTNPPNTRHEHTGCFFEQRHPQQLPNWQLSRGPPTSPKRTSFAFPQKDNFYLRKPPGTKKLFPVDRFPLKPARVNYKHIIEQMEEPPCNHHGEPQETQRLCCSSSTSSCAGPAKSSALGSFWGKPTIPKKGCY